jgi:hypothetical protein
VTHTPNSQPRGRLLVSTQRVELIFKDGGRARLHNVLVNGAADRYRRAVPHAAGEYIVDLRRLAPQLGDELCTTPPADVPFLLYMTFKLRFRTSAEFMSAVMANHTRHHEEALT